MTIYLNNAVFAKLDIKRDDLNDKTLKASSKKYRPLSLSPNILLRPLRHSNTGTIAKIFSTALIV